MIRSFVVVAVLLAPVASFVSADEPLQTPRTTRIVRTRDTLRVDIAAEAKPAARQMLSQLAWEPTDFRFTIASPNER